MALPFPLHAKDFLPVDAYSGTLVGRGWMPAANGIPAGPTVLVFRQEGVFDISEIASTLSDLLDLPDSVSIVKQTKGRFLGSLDALLQGTRSSAKFHGSDQPFLLAPCDLQVIKAAGVTFAGSLIERVIEERAKGDPQGAARIRGEISGVLGDSLANLHPGSAEASKLKDLLMGRGLWSQYLEVGIGPDAEVFTKAPILSALGTGQELGLHPKSSWNNPEPEVVLAINSRGAGSRRDTW